MPLPYDDTKTSVAKSRHDVEVLLGKWGVDSIQWTTLGLKSMLRFQFSDGDNLYNAKILVDPETQGRRWKKYGKGHSKRSEKAHYEHESKRLHRMLYWYVKSKIEAVQSGLETPAQAWLAAIEGPRGHTLYDELKDRIREIEAGDVSTIPMLPAASSE